MQMMDIAVRRTLGTLLGVLLLASPVGAQWEDGLVLPRGMIRVQAGGSFTTYDARFGSPAGADLAGHQPLATGFDVLLTSLVYSPLQRLETDVNRIFNATSDLGAPFQAGPENLFLRAAALHTAADQREAALAIDLGVLPRVQLGVRVPIVQNWLGARHLGISDGTVGVNPDPAFNRALLEQLGTGLGEIGARGFLPTGNSAVGRALQERVRAAGLEDLRLPEDPLAQAGVWGLPDTEVLETGRFAVGHLGWEPGDAEVRVRVQLLNTLAGASAPAPPRTSGYRGAVEVGVRVPTGIPPDADYLVFPLPRQGLTGGYVRLDNDLIASRRFGATVTLLWETVRPVEIEQRVWVPGDEFPPSFTVQPLRWEPGSRLSLAVAPRLRLVDEIALVARYRFQSAGGEAYVQLSSVIADGLEASAAARQQERIEATVTAHQVGIGIEFTTLPAAFAGRGTLPFEVGLYLRDTLAGSGGAADARVIEALARVYHPLWGRR